MPSPGNKAIFFFSVVMERIETRSAAQQCARRAFPALHFRDFYLTSGTQRISKYLTNGGRAWLLIRRDARSALARLVDDRDQVAIGDFLFRIGVHHGQRV